MNFQTLEGLSVFGAFWGLISIAPLFPDSIKNQLRDRHRSQANGDKISSSLLIKLLAKVV